MQVHRVLVKDDFGEDNAATAFHWTEDAGNASITVTSQKYQFAAGTGATTCRSHWTNLAIQTLSLEYFYTFKQSTNTTQPGYMWGMYFFNDSAAGAHYGNGYLVTIEDDGAGGKQINIYKIAANVLTSMATGAITAVWNVAKDFKITYNPSTGVIATFYRGKSSVPSDPWTAGPTWTDGTPIVSGSYTALIASAADVQFAKVRVRRPDDSPNFMEWPHVFHKASQGPSTWEMDVKLDSNGTTEWAIDDGIEIILQDNAGVGYEDFDGLCDHVDVDDERQVAHLSGRDWRGEACDNPGTYAGAAANSMTVVKSIITTYLTVLREGDVKASADAVAAFALAKKDAFQQIYDLAIGVSFSNWQTFWRHWFVTDTFNASGITIDSATDPIFGAKWVNTGSLDNFNIVEVHYAGPASTTYGSAGSSRPKTKIVVDLSIPDVAHATGVAVGYLARFNGAAKVLDFYALDYHELQVGDTLTLTVDTLNISAQSCLVVEKEYGPQIGGIRFRVVVGAGAVEVERIDTILKALGKIGKNLGSALSQV